MATTVQQLIGYLNEIEDKEQAVIYQYYTAGDFSAGDGTLDKETFEKVADEFDSLLPNDMEAIIETIADFLPEEEEEDE